MTAHDVSQQQILQKKLKKDHTSRKIDTLFRSCHRIRVSLLLMQNMAAWTCVSTNQTWFFVVFFFGFVSLNLSYWQKIPNFFDFDAVFPSFPQLSGYRYQYQWEGEKPADYITNWFIVSSNIWHKQIPCISVMFDKNYVSQSSMMQTDTFDLSYEYYKLTSCITEMYGTNWHLVLQYRMIRTNIFLSECFVRWKEPRNFC